MTRKVKAVFLLSVLLPINAYQLSFYDDVQTCAGEFFGSWVGGPAQGCQQEYVTASGVVVQSTGPADDDTNTIARFYSSNDCSDGTQIAEGNVGCIGIDGAGIGSFKSFKIDYTPLDDLPIISGAISGAPVTETGSLVARSPQTKTRASSTPTGTQKPKPFTHGDTTHFDGVPYRLQQIHEGGYIGIKSEEWDDNVHVKITTPQLPAKDIPGMSANLTAHPRELDERQSFNSVCQSAAMCGNRLIGGATGGAVALAGVFRDYLNAAQAQASQSNQQLGTFLQERPYFRELLFGFLSGAPLDTIGIIVGARVQSTNSATIQNCSVDGTQLSAIAAAFEARMSTLLTASAVTVTMFETVTDTVTFISMATVQCGMINEGDQCGMPTGTCIAPPH